MKKKLFSRNRRLVVMISSLALALPAQQARADYATVLSINSVPVAGATVSTNPIQVMLPSDNVINAADAVKVLLTGLTSGSTVTVSTSNAFIVSALSTTLNTVKSTDGITSATINVGTGNTAEFYIYTKSTSVGTFTVTSGGSSNTYYIKGSSAGPAYNLSVTLAATGYTSSIVAVPIQVTDVFGNPVPGVVPVVTAIGLTATSPIATDATGTTTTNLTFPSAPGRGAFQATVNAISIAGLPAAKGLFSSFIDVVSLADLLAAEKAGRAADKVAADAALAEAQKALNAALATKSTSDAQIAQLSKSNQELSSQISTLKNSLAFLQAKYSALVAKYNALAKRYKKPTIKG